MNFLIKINKPYIKKYIQQYNYKCLSYNLIDFILYNYFL